MPDIYQPYFPKKQDKTYKNYLLIKVPARHRLSTYSKPKISFHHNRSEQRRIAPKQKSRVMRILCNTKQKPKMLSDLRNTFVQMREKYQMKIELEKIMGEPIVSIIDHPNHKQSLKRNHTLKQFFSYLSTRNNPKGKTDQMDTKITENVEH